MISLQFKKKHLGYCANFMMNVVMSQYFYVASAVRSQLLSGTYGPEDLISVSIDPADLITLYQQLGEKQEKLCASINADMKATLLPQLVATAATGSAAANVLQQLAAFDTANQTAVNDMIDNGIAWLTK